MSGGWPRRGALGALAVVTVGLSGCGLPVPGLGSGGSAFDDALAAAGTSEDSEQRIMLQFSDTAAIREALDADRLERGGSDTQLMMVGMPALVLSPSPQGPKVPEEDYLAATSWTVSRGSHGRAVSHGPDLFDVVAPPLEDAGWARDGDALRAGQGKPPSIIGYVVSRDDSVLTGQTRELTDGMGATDLAEDERVTALRDCLGDDPLAVSLVVPEEPQDGYQAYAVTTEQDDDGLVTRACLIAEDAHGAADGLSDRETLGDPSYDVTDVEVDGDVVSARLVLRGDLQAARAPHATAHLSFPENRAPGF